MVIRIFQFFSLLTSADDDFVICLNVPCRQVLLLPSRHLERPAADDDFVKGQ